MKYYIETTYNGIMTSVDINGRICCFISSEKTLYSSLYIIRKVLIRHCDKFNPIRRGKNFSIKIK